VGGQPPPDRALRGMRRVQGGRGRRAPLRPPRVRPHDASLGGLALPPGRGRGRAGRRRRLPPRAHRDPVADGLDTRGTGLAPPGPDRAEPLDLDVGALSPRPITFPLITETQRSGALGDQQAVVAWREAAGREAAPADPLSPPERVDGPSIEEVILRRGSTRIM